MKEKKISSLIKKLECAPDREKVKVLLEIVEASYGAPIPEWWKGASAVRDVYDLHGIEAILSLGDAIKDEVKWREEKIAKAASR